MFCVNVSRVPQATLGKALCLRLVVSCQLWTPFDRKLDRYARGAADVELSLSIGSVTLVSELRASSPYSTQRSYQRGR